MSTLAHVLEAHGIATVAIASIRGQAESARPPRALSVDFPLGRPLGKPADPDYQHQVIAAAFGLLDRRNGPVLADFPDVIGAASAPLACSLPPRHDAGASPVVNELRGLRPAYDRRLNAAGGRTNVGRAVDDADGLEDVVAGYERITNGVALEDADLPGGHPCDGALDLRAYYEEAALSLSDHVPAARSTDSWFAEHTRVGALLSAVQQTLSDAGQPRDVWVQLLPLDRGILAEDYT